MQNTGNILIDLHGHSAGISRCCRAPHNEILDAALARGLDGIVLSNHYEKGYVRDGDVQEFVTRYLAEFDRAAEYADTVGARVFFGVEVSMILYPKVHLLVYGVGEDFLREYPCLYDMTQEELYRAVSAAGGCVVQAHPFRGGTTVLDPAYLDGIEVNCHPIYGKSYAEDLLRIGGETGLAVTCGGDYHADTAYRAKCGVYLPETVRDTFDLARHIKSARVFRLCIQEPNCEQVYDEVFVR